ncbi:protein FAM217B [Oncorhynchus keta]|uniref:protein FAM217B n=1 Tax=Oncorhynchus keta TaxID=8018 RepID=UPI0015FDFFD8|nr:protein FAM217B [Oncorhynchus keta]
MGPIMQERTASTALKRVVSKEKIRTKNSENNEPITSSKKANKVKKAGAQLKNALPGQDKDTVSTIQRGIHSKGSRVKSGTTRNTSKLASPQEGGLKSKPHTHSSTQRQEKREVQRTSPCCGELDQNHGVLGRSRKALSLPLSPIPGLRQGPMRLHTHTQVPTLESLRQFEQKEVDSDSASDLSDSERLPVLPSPCTPCTPPHLNLRAEVINSSDFPPAFPGPHGATSDNDSVSYNYPDFLPPPFNTWSLRQLAVFLHTEGRGAPRPKPVGPLEKYLERLLQLEWLQIQTVQAEACRPAGGRPRALGFPSATTTNAPRPHTAPPSRLSSPKGLRQCQRTFPLAPHNPPSLAAQQLSCLPVCPHCHIRYPLCNGSCSSYAYQRHSRLSPLLERRARPGVPPKRSSSESRVTSSESRATGCSGGGQTPGSPSAGRSHVRHMQAVGNIRKPAQEPGTNGKGQASVKKGRARANSEAEVRKESSMAKAGVEKHTHSGSKREANTIKRVEKDCQRTETGSQASKSGVKRTVKEPLSLFKAPLSAKANGKAKNVHFIAK